jgi:hypothetical protein
VLSKIEFFETATGRPDLSAERECLQTALCSRLNSFGRDVVVTPAVGGTLGVCFQAEISGEKKFLKTHLSGTKARANLAKEADILLRLYGDAVPIDRFEIGAADGTVRLCLLMPALAPLSAPMRPEEAAAMEREYHERLGEYLPDGLASSWDFDRYLVHARRAMTVLLDQSLLQKGTASDLRRLIAQLEDGIADQPRRLCHGDFGPKNIMMNGAQPLVIDWEDAFWGIAGYDYLYWLTFMENRPFLRDAAFGRTGHKPALERAILAFVVLLKSFLAVRSGAYLNHAVSVQSRIAEVLDLPNEA